MMASPKLIAKVLFAVAATASGLQQNVGTAEKLAAIELGNSAPLSEKGYQQIAAQRSDDEMKAFVHRVLAKEARYVKDVAELSGFVGFYSGTQGVQDLESLKKELRASPWVAEGEGRTAPLTDFGYQKVAKLKSNAHMMAFARRILNLNNKVCSDEGALIGLVPYYSGEVTVQSFDQLTRELLSAPWAVVPGAVALSEKTKEDPEAVEEPVETTIAPETTVATTTVVTTTLATTTLATTTLATTTLATTTLATTTVLTTLITTTLPTTTLPEEEEEEVEEALLEDVTFISKHSHDETDQGDDDQEKKDVTKEPNADNDGADKHSKSDAATAKKPDHAKAEADHSKTSKEDKKGKSNAAKEGKTNATKGSATAVNESVTKHADANATKKSKSKDAEKSGHSWFGWLTR